MAEYVPSQWYVGHRYWRTEEINNETVQKKNTNSRRDDQSQSESDWREEDEKEDSRHTIATREQSLWKFTN